MHLNDQKYEYLFEVFEFTKKNMIKVSMDMNVISMYFIGPFERFVPNEIA